MEAVEVTAIIDTGLQVPAALPVLLVAQGGEQRARLVILVRVFYGVERVCTCILVLCAGLEVKSPPSRLQESVGYLVVGIGHVARRAVVTRSRVQVPFVLVQADCQCRIDVAVFSSGQTSVDLIGLLCICSGCGLRDDVDSSREGIKGIVGALQHFDALNQHRVHRNVHGVFVGLRVGDVHSVEQYLHLPSRTAAHGEVGLHPARSAFAQVDTGQVLQQVAGCLDGQQTNLVGREVGN